MTFDFAPEWMSGAVADVSGTTQIPVAVPMLAPPPPCAPAHPTDSELAVLVGELFTEGTLSWDQLRTLANVGELRPLLIDTIAEVPLARRVTERR